MVVVSTEGLNFFMPIAAFLLVFLIVYAVLTKTKVLGDNNFVHFLISFILAAFFIVQVKLVEFVKFNAAWFAVFLVCAFLILILVGLTHGKVEVLQQPWLAWVLSVFLIGFFIVSAGFVFNWAINWDSVNGWFDTDWFGFVLLLVIAFVAAFVISRKK